MISLAGTLLDPHSQPLSNAEILFTAQRTYDSVLETTSASSKSNMDGEYTLSIPYGVYEIKVKQSGSRSYSVLARDVIVDEQTSAATLNALIRETRNYGELTNPIVAEFRELRTETLGYRDGAKASEEAAATSESNALASEIKAGEWAEQAVDVEVELGQYSALHHAVKASESATSADESEAAALASESKALLWAEELVDVEVEPGKYSSLHHAVKASGSASEAATSESNALASEQKSQLWAEQSVDVEVEPGKYSSLHHATKADERANAAASSEANALDSELKAEQWASYPEDAEITPGIYSALHYSKKAAKSAQGGMSYRGSWDASTGTYPGTAQTGWLHKINVAGTIDGIEYKVGDSIIYNGGDIALSEGWDKLDNTESVASVAGKVGDITLVKGDVGLPLVRNVVSYSQAEADTLLGDKLDASATAVAAYKLETPRTISLAGDVTGSVAFDGSANVAITVTIADDSHNHTIANIDGLQAALDAKLDDTDTASAIAITDPNGNYSATNVEDALAEESEARQAHENAVDPHPQYTTEQESINNAITFAIALG